MSEKKKLSEDSNAVKGRLGEREAFRLLERNGFTNVKRREKGEIGFDLKAEREGHSVTVEVKSTTGVYSIPDAYISEFDLSCELDPKLIADYLLVVRLTKKEKGGYTVEGGHLLPRGLVNSFKHRIKLGVVLSRDLQNLLKDTREYWINEN